MGLLNSTITRLIAATPDWHTVEERLDALVRLAESAENDELDRDAIDLLQESGITPVERREFVHMIDDRIITAEMVTTTVEHVKKAIAAKRLRNKVPASQASIIRARRQAHENCVG